MRGPGNRRSHSNRLEMVTRFFERLPGVDVARKDNLDVRSYMPRFNPLAHVVNRNIVELFDEAIRRMRIRMVRRMRELGKNTNRAAVWLALALAQLVANNFALAVDLLRIERLSEMSKAIGFHPQRKVEHSSRQCRKVCSVVFLDERVHPRGAGLLERREVRTGGSLRSGEHQMLAKMSEARLRPRLVGGPRP